jgi:hypothetical protein
LAAWARRLTPWIAVLLAVACVGDEDPGGQRDTSANDDRLPHGGGGDDDDDQRNLCERIMDVLYHTCGDDLDAMTEDEAVENCLDQRYYECYCFCWDTYQDGAECCSYAFCLDYCH